MHVHDHPHMCRFSEALMEVELLMRAVKRMLLSLGDNIGSTSRRSSFVIEKSNESLLSMEYVCGFRFDCVVLDNDIFTRDGSIEMESDNMDSLGGFARQCELRLQEIKPRLTYLLKRFGDLVV